MISRKLQRIEQLVLETRFATHESTLTAPKDGKKVQILITLINSNFPKFFFKKTKNVISRKLQEFAPSHLDKDSQFL